MIKTALVVIPTYNEAENIAEILEAIRSVPTKAAIEVLVVDSNSPDGTGQKLEKMKENFPGLLVLHQPRKMGLGRAYLDGFQFFREKFPGRYDAVITMDADFSHHPRYLSQMLEGLEQSDLVVGSRYVDGGRLENWPAGRKLLSRFANAYGKALTGVGLNDLTSGFHCFRTAVLLRVLQENIKAEGYAFLIELKYRTASNGFKIQEIPIVFADRTKGDSKISKKVILESALAVLRILVQRLFRKAPTPSGMGPPSITQSG